MAAEDTIRQVVPDRARWRGALLGGLVGDALGAPFEGRPPLVPTSEWTALASSTTGLSWTDDTAMTLAFAQSLVRCAGLEEDDLAAGFAEAWAGAPQRGYSTRSSDLLARIHAGESWRTAQRDGGRPSNGAAMRVAPAALCTTGPLPEVLDIAERSARITHPHSGAIAGGRVQAAVVAAALRYPADRPVDAEEFIAIAQSATTDESLRDRLDIARDLSVSGDPQQISARIGSGVLVNESVPAAICAALAHPASLPETIALAIRLGGDTDTVAAMAGAISGALLGEAAVPRRWIDRTRAGARVTELADALHALASPADDHPMS